MKNILLSFFLTIIVSTAFANNTAFFTINEEELNKDFAELIILEQAVCNNSGMTFNNAVSKNLIGDSFILSNGFNTMQEDFMFQWEGFLWGFLCCPVGFFVVAVNKNKPKNQKISFWIGVAASSVLSTITNIALIGSTSSQPTTYYY